MPCILLQISGERGIDAAVQHSATVKRANECSPSPGTLVALPTKAFNKLFPNQGLTERGKLANGSALQTWIEKIEAEPEVKSKRLLNCQTKLNTGNQSEAKVNFCTLIHLDVRTAIGEEAQKRGYTISGLVETVLVDWLNKNTNIKQKIENETVSKMEQAVYALGLLASKEYETFGDVDFREYLFEVPGKKLTALRKQFISAYKLTEDVGKLFESIPLTLSNTKVNRRHYVRFFAGFCGIDWTTIRQ